MSQLEIVGRADTLYSAYNALMVNTDGSINITNTDPVRTITPYEGTLTTNSPTFDCRGGRRVRIYGNTDNTSFLMIQYASTDIAPVENDWQYIDQLNPLTINGNIVVNKIIEIPPNYIRFVNPGTAHGLSFRIIVEK
jgi:deoxycytidine triphosphate deaminase